MTSVWMAFGPRVCSRCGKKYVPTGHYEKYCDRCRPLVLKEYKAAYNKRTLNKEYQQQYLEKHPEQYAETQKRSKARRRELGFVPLNAPFPDCEGHHVDSEQVIHIPEALHKSVYHNQCTGQGMAQINAVAYNYLFKQEVEAAIAAKGKR